MTTIDTAATSAAPASAGVSRVADWVTTTDHKKIGRLYLGVTALVAIAAVVVAVLLAFERVDTGGTLLPVDSLTQLFSLYRFGLTYAVMLPLVVGVATAVVPLQLGARSIAFPRLAAAGFWAWLLGTGISVVAIASNGGPNGGNAVFVDLFYLSCALALLGLLATTGAVLTTILTTRAPGMNLRRVPWFTWSVLVMAVALVAAIPMIVGNLVLLFVGHRYPSLSELSGNRAINDWAAFGFTAPTIGLFAIPALGFLADTVATATKARLTPRGTIFATVGLAGTAVFAAAVQQPVVIRTGFSSLSAGDKFSDLVPFFLVQVLPLLGAFLAVALSASGLKRRPTVGAPLVFALLASLLLLLGFAASALYHIGDAGLIGTVFEEGTWLAFVYGALLAGLGAVAHWGPKWWGRTMPTKATLPLALLGFLGAVLASLPLMVAGFADQPGGVFPAVEGGATSVVNFDYSGPSELWNGLSAAGHALVLLTVLAFVALALRAFAKGPHAGDDPWDGQTLEWATTSPAPTHNFAEVHLVKSAEPLLDLKPVNRSDA